MMVYNIPSQPITEIEGDFYMEEKILKNDIDIVATDEKTGEEKIRRIQMPVEVKVKNCAAHRRLVVELPTELKELVWVLNGMRGNVIVGKNEKGKYVKIFNLKTDS